METFLIKKSFFSGSLLIRKGDGIPDFGKIINDVDSILESSKITKDEIYVKAGVFEYSGKSFFIKKYSARNIFYRIGYFFKQTRAEHSWNASLLLENNFVANPKSYLVYTRKMFGFLRTSFLITEAVRDVFSRNYFRDKFLAEDVYEKFYAKIIKQLAIVHNAGIFHGDAKLWNFYSYKNEVGESAIGIWDLDGAIVYKEIPLRKRILDLARAIASIVELNREIGIDLYTSEFIDRIISFYDKYACCLVDGVKLEKSIGKFLAKKKIFMNPSLESICKKDFLEK